jgi:hypothetical protein
LLKLDRPTEARQQFEQCLVLPDIFWDDARHKEEARRLLDKLEKS